MQIEAPIKKVKNDGFLTLRLPSEIKYQFNELPGHRSEHLRLALEAYLEKLR